MRTKIIHAPQDLIDFSKNFELQSGHIVCIEYLEQSKVRAFVSASGKMIAGYVINSSSNLRYWKAIPQEKRTALLETFNFKSDDFCEVTCMWIDRSYTNLLDLAKMYWNCMIDSIICKKKYILAGTVIEKIKKRHMLQLPHLLYEGPISLNGQDFDKVGWLYFSETKYFIPRFIKSAIQGLIIRKLKKSITYLRNK